MASITLDAQYLASTLYGFLQKELEDYQDYSLPFLEEQEKIHGKGKPSIEGGQKVVLPYEDVDHSATTVFSNGYEPINLTVNAIGKSGEEDWLDCVRPIVISNHEKRINRGAEHKVIDLAEARTRNTLRGLRRQLHKRIFGMASSGLTDLVTLNGFDESTGVFESAAFGSQTNVVHGITKAAAIAFFQNQRAAGAGSFSANGLTGLDHIGIQGRSISDTGNKLRWYFSTSAIAHLKRAVRTNEQYIDTEKLDTGKLSLLYDGRPVRINRDMPNAGGTTTASPWSAVLVDHEAIKLYSQAGEYFRMGEMKELSGYDVMAAGLHFMGQLMAPKISTSGVLYNAEIW